MKNIAQNISDLVGKTPLLQLNNIAKQFNLKANLFANNNETLSKLKKI